MNVDLYIHVHLLNMDFEKILRLLYIRKQFEIRIQHLIVCRPVAN
jgi:hypothetical protein